MASAFFSQLRRKLLLFLFEIIELYLEQFGMFERLIQGGDKSWTQAFFADFQRCLEPLCPRLERSNLRVGERIHPSKLKQVLLGRD